MEILFVKYNCKTKGSNEPSYGGMMEVTDLKEFSNNIAEHLNKLLISVKQVESQVTKMEENQFKLINSIERMMLNENR